MSTHPNVKLVADALAAAGATGEVRILGEAVPTAAAAAELGCEVGAIANSLIFDGDGAPVLILTSGAHRVDTALEQYAVVWAAAGIPHSVFPTTCAQLLHLTNGIPSASTERTDDFGVRRESTCRPPHPGADRPETTDECGQDRRTVGRRVHRRSGEGRVVPDLPDRAGFR